ncbi:YfcC family protein [Salinispira pacifica]|uniref:Arginine/ornithine antiporter ArcD n=1 Tax=Salinispira pacifica TaxID=1307761 RepID=V5WKS2_9SPIO|nr:AbgT family transporter [Salinispira pacifica]AHC16139.1 hypothetical protein L21SP2_2789 [Salinispira pacifica]
MEQSIRIGKRAFLVSFAALFAIMIVAGLLSRVIEPGSYATAVENGREVLVPGSYESGDVEPLSFFQWLASPVLVLFSDDSLIILVIIAFIFIVSGAITVFQNTGIIPHLIDESVRRFRNRPKMLVAVLVLLFMAFGAFMGIFEEVVLLVPIAISIAVSMGWDRFTGLAISILAAGFGFSAAVSNPFSIGVAQQIAGLPLFSGAGFRLVIFTLTYFFLLIFIFRYIKRLGGITPVGSMAGAGSGSKQGARDPRSQPPRARPPRPAAYRAFLGSLLIILAYILGASAVPGLSDYSMPVIALVFFFSAWISGLLAGYSLKQLGSYFLRGILAVLPGVILILMAASVKYIIVEAGVLHTILYRASRIIQGQSDFFALAAIYLLVFILNLFVGSASAKALLVMPVIAPLADILGFTRQTAVLAFSFGDGFSNLLFPTNAVLLISLGISGVSYGSWFRFIFPVQAFMFLLSLGYLYLAYATGYGPF